MNDFFRFVGVIVLLFGTFVYTEKVQVASKVTDEILLKIDEVKSNYEVKAIEPIIKGNTIIPGKNGKEIDVSATYNVLAQSSSFNEKLFVYKPKYVKTKLEKNKNKFIVGACKNNKSIGLLFKVSDNDSISKVKQVLDKANVKATFYVTSGFFEKNYELVIRLISEGHTIGNLSNNEDYNDGNFAWMSTILTSSGSQKNNYCYASYLNKDVLKICNLHNSYTIVPGVIIDKNPFINVKKNITKGEIISLEVNRQLNDEAENIINYIVSKGYHILPLEELLKE